jgi:hypothetical protein
MSRAIGLALAVVLLVGVSSTSHAQMTSGSDDEMGTSGYGGHSYENPAFGGFGMDYMQVPQAGTFQMDRFGGVYAVPGSYPGMPQVFTAAPARTQSNNSRSGATSVRARYRVPTGSLYWPGAGGVLLYSPQLRNASYGSGYARSPYGRIDYGTMWLGWPIGY